MTKSQKYYIKNKEAITKRVKKYRASRKIYLDSKVAEYDAKPENKVIRAARHKEWVKGRPLHYSFTNMRTRCNIPSHKAYKNYGGRDIKVCSQWKTYKQFEADMLSTYVAGYHLHRIDNDGDYKPSNCAWMSPQDHKRLHQADKKDV